MYILPELKEKNKQTDKQTKTNFLHYRLDAWEAMLSHGEEQTLDSADLGLSPSSTAY